MNNKATGLFRNPYFIIIVTYFVTHFFMLILSGCWWDDWTFMTHDLNYINTVASESGRPEWNILVPFCWSLPNNGRIFIFFMYLLICLFVYRILLNCDLFSKEDSLIIVLLFIVMPVNDARILISNFAYNVGLFFFYLAFMLFVSWHKNDNLRKNIFYRIGILLLFFIGFILNSLLAYYYILFAYLFVIYMQNDDSDNNYFLKSVNCIKSILFSYPDFFILPFVYYGLNKLLFPTYGETFGNYNAVTVSKIINCLTYIPKSIIKVFLEIFSRCINSLNVWTVGILVCVIAIILLLIGNKQSKQNLNYFSSLKYFIYGLFLMAMGVFPYVMVRGHAIYSFGVKGRDAILVPLGSAILLYSLLSLLRGKIKILLSTCLIMLGVFGFNSLYIEWQKDYYYQLEMENLFDNEVIRNNDTFFLIELNETDIEAQRYYSLNMNAYNVFGDETRFFVPKASNLYILEDKEAMREAIEALAFSHMMRDYHPDDYNFDAILDYRNYFSGEDVLKLKYYELFDKEKFDNKIKGSGVMEIYVVDDDFTVSLLKEYDKGNVQSDEDVLDYVLEYAK